MYNSKNYTFDKLRLFEAVKFFNLDSLSSPILVKVHFDIVMTMIADTLYTVHAKKLRGFESCDARRSFGYSSREKERYASATRKLLSPILEGLIIQSLDLYLGTDSLNPFLG